MDVLGQPPVLDTGWDEPYDVPSFLEVHLTLLRWFFWEWVLG